jgi:hypothetical protein
MSLSIRSRWIRTSAVAALAAGLFASTSALADGERTGTFTGPKANTGYVTHTRSGGRSILTLSPDFQVPDTPDPHWQVVDSKGEVYLLQRLPIKGDKVNRTISVPSYVPDVAKVQIWCAFAEVVLGEASFLAPVR